MASILLVDDRQESLNDLIAAVKGCTDAKIETWMPKSDDGDPQAAFKKHVSDETVMVVADSDLTANGLTGLFGASIVSWCQTLMIPVGDFSRKKQTLPLLQQSFFELRIPPEPEKAGAFIAAAFEGFSRIKQHLSDDHKLLEKASPAAVLAEILGVPDQESQFALYSVRAASSVLMSQVADAAQADPKDVPSRKLRLLTYLVGHLLLNSVLRFPGPILSTAALAGYLGYEGDNAQDSDVLALFESAAYTGPFKSLDRFFWLQGVDAALEPLLSDLPETVNAETRGELHRLAVEKKLGRQLKRHGCERCGGTNGGFVCPFTQAVVCQRSECSVGSNSWIPQGASMCRIEKDFFDEWAPLVGL